MAMTLERLQIARINIDALKRGNFTGAADLMQELVEEVERLQDSLELKRRTSVASAPLKKVIKVMKRIRQSRDQKRARG